MSWMDACGQLYCHASPHLQTQDPSADLSIVSGSSEVVWEQKLCFVGVSREWYKV